MDSLAARYCNRFGGLGLPNGIPEPVAAALLKAELSEALMESMGRDAKIPDGLAQLEGEPRIAERAVLIADSAQEVSAWFASRCMTLTSRGLRDLKPKFGDLVTRADDASDRMVISSICICNNGKIYKKDAGENGLSPTA